MKKILIFIFVIITTHLNLSAQQSNIPFKEIPKYPANYTSGNVLARMVDGLGYRYYWASEGLDKGNMDYKPSEDARTMLQTMEHLYGLSNMILNSLIDKPNTNDSDKPFDNHEELRVATLNNFKKTSDLLINKTSEEVAELNIAFQNGDQTNEIAFWHMINGPIADAIYHTGQLVSFRRSVGNPMNPKVNVFWGKTGK